MPLAEAEKILEEPSKRPLQSWPTQRRKRRRVKAAKETAQKDDTVAKEAAPAHDPYDDMVPIRLFKDNGRVQGRRFL